MELLNKYQQQMHPQMLVSLHMNTTIRFVVTLQEVQELNLFDMYYDKFKTGLKIIDYGKGTIKPALWGYNNPKTKTKKRK